MIIYKVFYQNFERRRGELLGVLPERRRDLRGMTLYESGLRLARFTFGGLVKDKRAITVVPKLVSEGQEYWLS